MNSNEVDLICTALIDYKMIPRKRVTKKEKDTYSNMRRSMRDNKQNKTNILCKLALALIKEQTNLNPKLTQDYSSFFIEIMNSYPNRNVSEIVEMEVHKSQLVSQSLKKAERRRYDAEQEKDRITKLKNKEIQDLNLNIQELRKELEQSNKTKTFYFNELSKYDSDISSEEEAESINYQQQEVNSALRAKLTELSAILVSRDEEIVYLKNKQTLFDQMVEENESMKS